MIAAISLNQLMAEIPPTLRAREGAKIHEQAKEFGVRILSARNIDGAGNWSHLALDISGSNKLALFDFLRTVQAASVTIQPADLPMFFSDHILEAVRVNWTMFQTSLTDLPLDEIADTCDRIGASIWQHQPAERPMADPNSEYDLNGNWIGTAELRNETYFEMQRQQEAADKAEQEALIRNSDPWNQGFYN